MDVVRQEGDEGSPERLAPGDRPPWLRGSWRDGCRVIEAGGSVQLAVAEALQHALVDALRPGRALVADLTGVDFLDSSGLRALVLAQRAAMDAGARLLVVPSPMITAVIELGRLGSVLTLCPDLAQALAEAGATPGAPHGAVQGAARTPVG